MQFAEQVKNARMELNMNQTEFAQQINVSFNTINRWERGKTEPHPLVRDAFYAYCKKHNLKSCNAEL